MLQAYTINTTGVALTAGTNINFDNIKLQNLSTALLNGKTIELRKTGRYLVQFDGEFGTATGATVQMYNNGVIVPDAVGTTDATATTDNQPIAFNTIVEVLPSCCAVDNTARLTFNVPVGATMYKANVVVHRLCQ